MPHEHSGTAGGAFDTFRRLGFAFGAAIFGTVFTDVSCAQNAYADGLSDAIVLAGGSALVAALALGLPAGREAERPVKIG